MTNVVSIYKKHTLTEHIFYSNCFYGICAVGLSIEASLQQRFPLNPFYYYLLTFAATVLYYTYPYARKKTPGSQNPRTRWYARYYQLIVRSQIVLTTVLLIAFGWFIISFKNALITIQPLVLLLILVFPFVAALYYGFNILSGKYNLRRIGWLKPFIIGFTWAGFANIYPALFYCITHNVEYVPTFFMSLLFLKNLMFVAVLCIMFDIKDYATDFNYSVSTFVVRIGLKKTIFFVLLPLSLLGLFTFWGYAITHQFSAGKVILNTIPFLLLITTCYSLRKRRSLLYYLIIIDGLMIVKAICGIIAMLYF